MGYFLGIIRRERGNEDRWGDRPPAASLRGTGIKRGQEEKEIRGDLKRS